MLRPQTKIVKILNREVSLFRKDSKIVIYSLETKFFKTSFYHIFPSFFSNVNINNVRGKKELEKLIYRKVS